MTGSLLLSPFLTISTLGEVPNERGTPDEPVEIVQRDWTVATSQQTSQRIDVSANVLMSGDRPQTPLAEPHLAINPKDANHLVVASIVAGFRGVALFVSFDGGDSWQSVRLKGLHDLTGFGDPWVTFDQKGIVYLVGLGRPSNALVWRSGDGGLTWSQPTAIPGRAFDHTSITVDGRGMIYVFASQSVRRDDGTVGHPVIVARSTDGGVSFEDPLALSPTNLKYQAGMPAVLRDGSVAFSYFDFATERTTSRNLRTRRIWFARLAENGQRFSLPAFVGEVTDFRNGFSPFAVDTSPTSPFTGRLYVASANLDSLDQGVHVNELDASFLLDTEVGVLLNYSKDNGVTWSRPHLVAQGFAEAWRVNLAVNPQGVIALAWMQRTDEADVGFEPYVTVSVDGGITFVQAVRVSDTKSVLDSRVPGNIFEGFDVARRWPAGGDYFGLASDDDGVFHIVWADSRTGVFQLWSAKITVKKSQRFRSR